MQGAALNEEEEVEQLREMFKKESPPRKKKTSSTARSPPPPWNDSPMRPAPWALRGIKSQREPWAEDAAVYNKKCVLPSSACAGGHEARSDVARAADAAVRRFGNLHGAKFGPSNQAAAAHMLGRNTREMPKADGTTWDPSTFRNAPWPLRGLKPVTREPWYHDAAIYNSKFCDDPLEVRAALSRCRQRRPSDGTTSAAQSPRALPSEARARALCACVAPWRRRRGRRA
jgi:hypothetical protein